MKKAVLYIFGSYFLLLSMFFVGWSCEEPVQDFGSTNTKLVERVSDNNKEINDLQNKVGKLEAEVRFLNEIVRERLFLDASTALNEFNDGIGLGNGCDAPKTYWKANKFDFKDRFVQLNNAYLEVGQALRNNGGVISVQNAVRDGILIYTCEGDKVEIK